MIEILKEIETKYDVSSITYKNIQVWPFLRIPYYYKYLYYKYGVFDGEALKDNFNKLERINNSLYGLDNLLRKYNYFVFTDTGEKKLVNKKYVDKIAETLISEIGRNNTLVIEQPIQGLHFNRQEILSKHIISLELFRFLYTIIAILSAKFTSNNRLTINNQSILDEINKKYSLNIDYKILIYRFFCYKKLFRNFLKIYNPDAIFINCYYRPEYQAAIYSAKELGIKTIELQHGLINEKHAAYNIFTELDKNFFPDYLLCFGDYFKNSFKNKNFINPQHIYSIGNGYIDYINNYYNGDKKLIELIRKYKKSVAVSSIPEIEHKQIPFIREAAMNNKNIIYIFIPRIPNKNYSYANFPSNVVFFKHLDFYKIVKYVDFHSTIFSTCAFEAPAIGTPNILINIDNLAKEYLSVLLEDKELTKLTDSVNEFVNIILNWDRKNSDEIKKRHSGFFADNHREKLRIALSEILGRKFG